MEGGEYTAAKELREGVSRVGYILNCDTMSFEPRNTSLAPFRARQARERSLSEISPVNIQNFSSTSRRECLVSLCRIVGSWLALDIDVKRMALNIMKLALGELSVDVTILWGIPTGLLCALEGTYGKVLPRQRKF